MILAASEQVLMDFYLLDFGLKVSNLAIQQLCSLFAFKQKVLSTIWFSHQATNSKKRRHWVESPSRAYRSWPVHYFVTPGGLIWSERKHLQTNIASWPPINLTRALEITKQDEKFPQLFVSVASLLARSIGKIIHF